MKHLISISDLTANDVFSLVQRATYFLMINSPNINSPFSPLCQIPLPQYTIATLFYENSTRTRISFELAAKRLGMTMIQYNPETSSLKKGETLLDTVQNLTAMGIHYFIIRHSSEAILPELRTHLGDKISLLNAGDGQNEHPSQALLDLMTILQHKPDFDHIKLTIIGDLRHSRVANSMQKLCALIGLKQLTLVSPECWKPRTIYHGSWTSSLKAGIQDADVVMTLRIQNERLDAQDSWERTSYHQQYALTSKQLSLAKPNAIVMHPGPINRGIEIDSNIADGPQSVILQQVTNGVAMRMAILEHLINAHPFNKKRE